MAYAVPPRISPLLQPKVEIMMARARSSCPRLENDVERRRRYAIRRRVLLTSGGGDEVRAFASR
jgi:hypothetical protein